ncbi:MAG: septal ring lytic transglycosylase RlpA family protein [Actinomycetota bacterium]
MTTTSISLAAEATAPVARIAASDSTVPYGERIALAGSVPGSPSTPVGLKFRPAGSNDWRAVRQVSTDAAANYRTSVRARRSGAYQAVPASAQASDPVKVRVRARPSFHTASRNPVVGGRVRLHGRVKPAGTRTIRIKVGGRTVEKATTARNGSFSLRWTPDGPGTYQVRAVAGRNGLARSGRSVPRTVTAFRRAAASWYGPGLYGNGMACGGTLTPGTLGVAHKTLPCGTKLTLRYGSRSVRVKVVDRGPFSGSREFDLTSATKQRLGFPDTGYVLTSK